jgi:hypothetical protein
MLIRGILEYAEDQAMHPSEVLAEWETLFEASKYSVSNLVKGLQRLGKLKKHKPCGKTGTKQ